MTSFPVPWRLVSILASNRSSLSHLSWCVLVLVGIGAWRGLSHRHRLGLWEFRQRLCLKLLSVWSSKRGLFLNPHSIYHSVSRQTFIAVSRKWGGIAGTTCPVCLDGPVTMAFIPCGHCTCEGCFTKLTLLAQEKEEMVKCPTCRLSATGFQPLRCTKP